MAPEERRYRRTWWSWALYDVANSAFYLVIVAAVFPVFFIDLYVQHHGPEMQDIRQKGGAALGYSAVTAMAIVAVLGPVLGAVADRSASKKRLLAIFAGLGVTATGLMGLIGPGQVLFAAVLYAAGTIGAAGSIVFYDALLPGVARKEDLDRISAVGFAAGYIGSVVLFIANILMIEHPGWFGLDGKLAAVKASFVTVAAWWALFTIPILRNVPEPPVDAGGPGGNLIVEGFRQLGRTFRKLRSHRQLLLFLVAFWIYSDGIGTIIKMAASFGSILGVGTKDLMMAIVLTQVVGAPCAIAFGWMARRTGAKAGILVTLAVYAGICLFASQMSRPWHFYVLAVSVGLVQGGAQSLSRSLFASMAPPAQSAEFFGFFSSMEKFAGILGPLLLSYLWGQGGDPRKGITALVVFFVIGGLLLWRVDVDAGRAAATAPDGTAKDRLPASAP